MDDREHAEKRLAELGFARNPQGRWVPPRGAALRVLLEGAELVRLLGAGRFASLPMWEGGSR